MMNKPLHCGKLCQPVMLRQIVSKRPFFNCWIQFFRCRVCGEQFVPYQTSADTSYMDSLEPLRLAAIAEETIRYGT
jgi:hypothetical protein